MSAARKFDVKLYHRADKISSVGVSALCYKRPRPIPMATKNETWTIRDEAVTCPKCLKILRERGKVTVQ